MNEERYSLMEDAIKEALAGNMIGSNEPSVTISRAAYDKMQALFPKTIPDAKEKVEP